MTTTDELIRRTEEVIADLRAAVAASRRARGADPADDSDEANKQHGRTS